MGMHQTLRALKHRRVGIIVSFALAVCSQQAAAIDCQTPLTENELASALMAENSAYYPAIGVRLRRDAANLNQDNDQDEGENASAVEDSICNLYRAADGMQGALCVYIAEAADDMMTVELEQPLGSYGDNAVDRILTVPTAADGTISCDLVDQFQLAANAQPYLPVETNPKAGQVCLRDVMRAPGVPEVQNALIRDAAGAEFSTGPLVNTGDGCFKLDETYPPGSFQVLSFEVDTANAGQIDLGNVSNLVQPNSMASGLSGVWFVDFEASGAGNGSLAAPYTSVSSFNAAQGSASGPQPGDFIYLINGTTDEFSAPVTLLDGQWLVGRGNGLIDALAAYGVMPDENSELINSPLSTAGDPSELTGFERPSLELARNNTLYGLSLSTAFAPALEADDQGSLTVRNTTVIANNGGVAVLSNMLLDVELNNVFAGGGFTVNALDLKNTTGRLKIDGGELMAVSLDGDPELGRALSIVDAENITLNDVEISASDTGVFGRNVANFSLTNSSVVPAEISDRLPAAGVDFENLTGDVTLENVVISAGTDTNLRIHNVTDTLSAALTSLDLGDQTLDTQTSVRFEGDGDATMSITLSDSLIHGAKNRATECIVAGGANLNCFLVDNQVFQASEANDGNRFRLQPLLFASAASENSQLDQFVMNYSVIGTTPGAYTINDSFRGAIAADFREGSGVANGVISNLRFGEDGNPLSGALFGNAIEISTASDIDHNLLLTDTQIFGAFNDGALRILAAGSTATTIRNLQFFGEDANFPIQLSDTASATMGNQVTHCVDIADSTLVGWDSAVYFALSQRSSVEGRIQLPGYQGSPNGEEASPAGTASADITSYLQSRNVNLVSFNPDITPTAYAPNVLGLQTTQSACNSSL